MQYITECLSMDLVQSEQLQSLLSQELSTILRLAPA